MHERLVRAHNRFVYRPPSCACPRPAGRDPRAAAGHRPRQPVLGAQPRPRRARRLAAPAVAARHPRRARAGRGVRRRGGAADHAAGDGLRVQPGELLVLPRPAGACGGAGRKSATPSASATTTWCTTPDLAPIRRRRRAHRPQAASTSRPSSRCGANTASASTPAARPTWCTSTCGTAASASSAPASPAAPRPSTGGRWASGCCASPFSPWASSPASTGRPCAWPSARELPPQTRAPARGDDLMNAWKTLARSCCPSPACACFCCPRHPAGLEMLDRLEGGAIGRAALTACACAPATAPGVPPAGARPRRLRRGAGPGRHRLRRGWMDDKWAPTTSPPCSPCCRSNRRCWPTPSTGGCCAPDRPPPAAPAAGQHRSGSGATSRPTTTWATISTACGSTRHDLLVAVCSPRRRVAWEDAQLRKYRRILTELDAKPGQTILEIGCGWVACRVAATEFGCRVLGLTLSPAQLARRASAPSAAATPTRSTWSCATTATCAAATTHRVHRDDPGRRRALSGPPTSPGCRPASKPGGRCVVQPSPSPTTLFCPLPPRHRLHPALHLPGRHAALPARWRQQAGQGQPGDRRRLRLRPRLRPQPGPLAPQFLRPSSAPCGPGA